MVVGHSRMMWARFVARQDLPTVLRCHIAAFEAFGGVPGQILYDRMKTAVLGEAEDPDQPGRGIASNAKLLDLVAHYGFLPKACKPYRAKTKGKVERPFRYVREDFFLARTFGNLDDLFRPYERRRTNRAEVQLPWASAVICRWPPDSVSSVSMPRPRGPSAQRPWLRPNSNPRRSFGLSIY